MRFFKRREHEPQGQPKEASELPVYLEDEPMYSFRQSVRTPSKLLHDAQYHFYASRGTSAFEIKERKVVNAIAEAGYTCDPVIDAKERGVKDWYYTDVPLEHGVPIILLGIEVERRGMTIVTSAQYQRELEESGRQWRQERRNYYQQRRRKNT